MNEHEINVSALIGCLALVQLWNRFHQVIIDRCGRVGLVRRHVLCREKCRGTIRDIVTDHYPISISQRRDCATYGFRCGKLGQSRYVCSLSLELRLHPSRTPRPGLDKLRSRVAESWLLIEA